jgi:F-type H+-transporting ATPase subunit a
VTYLTYSLVLPPFLYAFFGFFVGTIQAFVFTMLTLVYIAVQVE